MPTLSPANRRGLRMAAQVACALSLLGATASLAHGEEDTPGASTIASEPSSSHPVERAAQLLRLQSKGNCVPTWGPPAPPAVDAELFALFLEVA